MEKIVLITGASKGIGKALAEIFAKNGYALILIARSEAALLQLQQELKNKYQSSVKVIAADLAEATAIDRIMDAIQEEAKNVEILINNAGYGILKKLTDIPQVDVVGMLDVNIRALTQLTYRLLPFMVAKKSGKIMNVASTAAFAPGPYMSIYYATKAYVLRFSEGIREEFSEDGVHVSILCPGVTETEFQKRAGMEEFIFKNKKMLQAMSAQQVADIAYQGLMNNKRMIVPGAMNKLMRFGMWLFPHALVAKIISELQKSRK